MKLDMLNILATISFLALVSAGEQTCSQLTSGQQPTNDEDKRKAQLCHLTELAEVLNGMTATLHEAMIAVLTEQGVTIDDASTNEVEKRKNEYLRFGKRKHEYLRFGKRKHEYLRYGK